jgi:hypothetical protein
MSELQFRPTKGKSNRTPKLGVRVDYSFYSEEEPEFSPQLLSRLKAKINRDLNQEAAVAGPCQTGSCASEVGKLQKLANDLLSIKFKCTSKCKVVKVGNSWQKVCTFECKSKKSKILGTIK